MATIDYILQGDHEAARRVFDEALAGQGFTISPYPNGSFRVERGSKQATFWLGAFAGKAKQHLVFTASYFVNGSDLVARIERGSGSGAMAGAVGVARSNAAFAEVDQAIGQSLTNAGILRDVVRA